MRTTVLPISRASILLAVSGRIMLSPGSAPQDGHVKVMWTELTRGNRQNHTCAPGVLGLAPLTVKQPKIIILRLSNLLM